MPFRGQGCLHEPAGTLRRCLRPCKGVGAPFSGRHLQGWERSCGLLLSGRGPALNDRGAIRRHEDLFSEKRSGSSGVAPVSFPPSDGDSDHDRSLPRTDGGWKMEGNCDMRHGDIRTSKALDCTRFARISDGGPIGRKGDRVGKHPARCPDASCGSERFSEFRKDGHDRAVGTRRCAELRRRNGNDASLLRILAGDGLANSHKNPCHRRSSERKVVLEERPSHLFLLRLSHRETNRGVEGKRGGRSPRCPKTSSVRRPFKRATFRPLRPRQMKS